MTLPHVSLDIHIKVESNESATDHEEISALIATLKDAQDDAIAAGGAGVMDALKYYGVDLSVVSDVTVSVTSAVEVDAAMHGPIVQWSAPDFTPPES